MCEPNEYSAQVQDIPKVDVEGGERTVCADANNTGDKAKFPSVEVKSNGVGGSAGELPGHYTTGSNESNVFPRYPHIPTITLSKHRIPIQNSGVSIPTFNPRPPQVSAFQPTNGFYSEVSWPEQRANMNERSEGANTRGGNRGRTTYSDEQIMELEKIFSHNPYPTPQSRQRLARDINVPEGKVKIWFQNRRARAKKQRVSNGGWRASVRGSQHVNSSSAQKHNINNNNMLSKSMYEEDSTAINDASVTAAHTTNLANSFVSASGVSQDLPNSSRLDSGQSALSLSCLSLGQATRSVCMNDNNRSNMSSVPLAAANYSHTSSFAHSSNENGNFSYNWRAKSSNPLNSSCQVTSKENCLSSDTAITYPERFPVIHNTLEYQNTINCGAGRYLAPSSIPRCFIVTTASQQTSTQKFGNFSNEASRTGCYSQSLSGTYAFNFDGGKLNSKHACAKHVSGIDVYSVPGSSKTRLFSTTPTYSPYIHSSTTPSFMQSPPPIRRFVFPFENLLENAQKTNFNEKEPVHNLNRSEVGKNVFNDPNTGGSYLGNRYYSDCGDHAAKYHHDNYEVQSSVAFENESELAVSANRRFSRLWLQDLSSNDERNLAEEANQRELAHNTGSDSRYCVWQSNYGKEERTLTGTCREQYGIYNADMSNKDATRNSENMSNLSSWNSQSASQLYENESAHWSGSRDSSVEKLREQYRSQHQQESEQTRCSSGGSAESVCSQDGHTVKHRQQAAWPATGLVSGAKRPSSAPMIG